MRFVIIGYGVQGRKRKNLLGDLCQFIVDPVSNDSDFLSIQDVPLDSFDAAIVCTPDSEKFQVINYLVENGKHVLCEKPLYFPSIEDFHLIEAKARATAATLYTAYNHRFETSIVRAKHMINSGFLGKTYLVKLFYGNGTAKLVASSSWRDSGVGVILDLGSHCLDIIRYWFPGIQFTLRLAQENRFENLSQDYAMLISIDTSPTIVLELSLCSWKNMFRAEIVGQNGSIAIDGLQKWGRSKIVRSQRVFPSGYPLEEIEYFEPGDKTWELEQNNFVELIRKRAPINLENDIFIFKLLHEELCKS